VKCHSWNFERRTDIYYLKHDECPTCRRRTSWSGCAVGAGSVAVHLVRCVRTINISITPEWTHSRTVNGRIGTLNCCEQTPAIVTVTVVAITTCSWTRQMQQQARGHHFSTGVNVKNQALTCNMIRWFSTHTFISCWLLMQYMGKGPKCTWVNKYTT